MYLKLAQKILLACLFCMVCSMGFGQDIPKTIPPFNMVLADGVTYHNADKIEKGKPLMIVYFDPECEHCQAFTKDMIKSLSKFSNDQIVMICSSPGLPPLKRFIEQFSLDKYANIKAGTEGMYHATMNFYKVDVTPFVALYDKAGALISFYRNVPAPTKLAKELNK